MCLNDRALVLGEMAKEASTTNVRKLKRRGCLETIYISRLGNSCNFCVLFWFFSYNVQVKFVLCTKAQTTKCLGSITHLVPCRPPQSKPVLCIEGSSCTLCAGLS